MTPREELLAAVEVLKEMAAEGDGGKDSEFFLIMADWILTEANQHVHLAGLDSGYDEMSIWDDPRMLPEVIDMQPSIRMARLLAKVMEESAEEDEDGTEVPPLPKTDR